MLFNLLKYINYKNILKSLNNKCYTFITFLKYTNEKI